MSLYNYPALLALLSLFSSSLAKNGPKDALLLSQVRSLIFRANARTTHHRVSAIHQLTCTGPACRYYKTDTMRCINQGANHNEEDIQWSCSANLPKGFTLGATEVNCEGYSNKDDPYVLKGSCGAEYRLLLTDVGEKKYEKGDTIWSSSSTREGKGLNSNGVLSIVIFIVVIAALCYLAQVAPAGHRSERRRRRLGGRIFSSQSSAKHTSSGFGSTSRR